MTQTSPILKVTLTDQVVPYVRMTQRGKYVRRQALRYLSWKTRAEHELLQARLAAEMELLGGTHPLAVMIHIRQAGALSKSDLDNQVKAILDAASGIIFYDDRHVNALVASRFQLANAPFLATLEIRHLADGPVVHLSEFEATIILNALTSGGDEMVEAAIKTLTTRWGTQFTEESVR